jgi:hypothetical protein
MKALRIFMLAGCLVLMGTAALQNAKADEWNKLTKMTFSGPVELPGMVLPAGTYTFKLMDSDVIRSIVQVWNEDQTKLFATLLAIPDYRMEPSDKTVVSFEEREKGAPEAVKAWFYPGDQYGLEFVYPKVRATQLAQSNKQHVPSMPDRMAKVTAPAELKKAEVTAIQPSGKEVRLAEVHTTPPAPKAQPTPAPAQMAMATPKELPKTASPMPHIGLIGILALAGAVGIRQLAKAIG